MSDLVIADRDFQLWQGDASFVLADKLASECVDTVITSPPYFRLRDYGVRGQIGLEPSIGDYVAKLTRVFSEVRRVLKDTGSLWLNIDDSYAGGGNYRGVTSEKTLTEKQRSNGGARGVSQALGGIKDIPAKNLCLIPHRLAIALQEDGWYVRQEVIWSKPNPMVESAKDRCTRQHEYLFHLTKKPRYDWDWEAAQEPADWERWGTQTEMKGYWPKDPLDYGVDKTRRNMRNVWSIPSANYPDAHYAVFPEELVERCIKLTCPPGGTVLDPFMGSGTVAYVARKMGRKAVGIELSPEYVQMIVRRTEQWSLFA